MYVFNLSYIFQSIMYLSIYCIYQSIVSSPCMMDVHDAACILRMLDVSYGCELVDYSMSHTAVSLLTSGCPEATVCCASKGCVCGCVGVCVMERERERR